MQRRTLLKWGLAGSVVLSLGGGLLSLVRPGWSSNHLTVAGREIFSAVAQAMLDGLLPSIAERDMALTAHLTRIEATIAGLPPHAQAEVAKLLALIGHPVGRLIMVGLSRDWAQASVTEVQAALQEMRESCLAPRQQIYLALHELTNGGWFSAPSTWASVGYPGPIDV